MARAYMTGGLGAEGIPGGDENGRAKFDGIGFPMRLIPCRKGALHDQTTKDGENRSIRSA
jgi:hypothetical protein